MLQITQVELGGRQSDNYIESEAISSIFAEV